MRLRKRGEPASYAWPEGESDPQEFPQPSEGVQFGGASHAPGLSPLTHPNTKGEVARSVWTNDNGLKRAIFGEKFFL